MIEAATRSLVIRRARSRCEYCHIHQDFEPFYRFQIEHIVPRKHRGADLIGNLALACRSCNLHKGSNLTGIDPKLDRIERLFNPRRHSWRHHFQWSKSLLVGKTPIGRATIAVLEINKPDRVALREILIVTGQWKPE